MTTFSSLHRRHLLSAASLFALGVSPVRAQGEFPDRPVRFVSGSSAGSTPDVVTRLMADNLSKRWKQPVVVDNRVGASGMIATEHVARASPDGYTVLFTSQTAHIYNPLLRKTSYDPFKDFLPLSELVSGPIALVAARDAPFSNIKELVSWAKQRGKGISYGTWGVGGGGHLLGEQMKSQVQMEMLHVPYKNAETGIVQDLAGGTLDIGFLSGGTAKNQAQGGIAKLLAVTGDKRSRQLPDTPTFMEQGLSGMQFGGWISAYAPANTPKAIVQKLSAGLREVLAQPEVASKLESITFDVVASTPEELLASNQTEHRQWAALLRKINIKLD